MEFNKAYNRQEFVSFLQNKFLPEDFIPTEEPVAFRTQMTYSTQAVELGSSESLGLMVYEVRHSSKNNARVSLSKEAFRMLADEGKDRALVVFIPEDNDDNYRLSFIEITLDIAEGMSRITRCCQCRGFAKPLLCRGTYQRVLSGIVGLVRVGY